MYAKNPYEAGNQYLINKRGKVGLNDYEILKLLLNIQIICKISKKILKNTIWKKCEVLILFGDMIAHVINSKEINPVIIKFFIRHRNLSISIVFIEQQYFKVPKEVRLNTTHFFIMKIPSRC